MKKNGFTLCANDYIGCLRKEGRYATAHVYQNALRSFTLFCGTKTVSFTQVTRETLKRYNSHLLACRLSLNTVSTYMRMLRSIYNRGVGEGHAPYVYRLFHEVFTGVDICQKKAIPADELHTLFYKDPGSDKLRRTQDIAHLLFLFSGMPFADLAHLEKSNLESGVLRYHRIKTGASMSVEVLDTAGRIMCRLRNSQESEGADHPDYLFSILSGKHRRTDESSYIEYQSILRRFNNQLKSLAKHLRLRSPVTSYSLRHSWATTAKYRGVPIEMISESLGHKSIKTTQIYLKSFNIEERTKVNKQNYNYIKNKASI